MKPNGNIGARLSRSVTIVCVQTLSLHFLLGQSWNLGYGRKKWGPNFAVQSCQYVQLNVFGQGCIVWKLIKRQSFLKVQIFL